MLDLRAAGTRARELEGRSESNQRAAARPEDRVSAQDLEGQSIKPSLEDREMVVGPRDDLADLLLLLPKARGPARSV